MYSQIGNQRDDWGKFGSVDEITPCEGEISANFQKHSQKFSIMIVSINKVVGMLYGL